MKERNHLLSRGTNLMGVIKLKSAALKKAS